MLTLGKDFDLRYPRPTLETANDHMRNNILLESFGLQKRWVNHKDKIPIMPSGRPASSTDSSTWSTYQEVIGRSPNIGIVFMSDQLLLGIDLDHCLNGNVIDHEEKENIAQLIIEANTYSEISPSGTGLHIYLSLTTPLKLVANRNKNFEAYTSGRYFTVTNNPYKEALPIRTVTPKEAIELLEIIGYPWGKTETQENIPIHTTLSLGDEIVLSKMFSSKNGDKIEALYNGDISEYNEDDSSADMALCSHLTFWTGRNAGQIERIWLNSPLGSREKTQDRKDYRDRTITNAIKNCDEVYRPKEGEIEEPIKILSFLELMNKEFPEIPWDIEGIFESGTINMISAPPNQYKSWVVQHIAFCLAQSKEVFGHFKTKTQNTLIINEEDSLRMIKDRSLKMVKNTSDLGVYFMVGSGFKIDENTVKEILIQAEKINATFIIFDSLRSVHNANENDSQDMQKIMDHFKYLTRNGKTVLFTHHNRKKDKFQNKNDNSGEEARGSTAINAAVHGHLSCEETIKEDGKHLLISQRKLKCDEKLKPFLVKIEIDKENNKINFNYEGEYDAKEESFRRNKEHILSFINGSNEWLCKKQISSFAQMGDSGVAKILQELEKEKLIQSKTTKELIKLNIQINNPGLKSNAKFYFKNEVVDLDQFIAEIQSDDDF